MQQESILSSPLDLSPTPTPFRRADRWLRRAVFQRLQKLAQGCVTIADIDGNHAFGQVSAACPLRATVTIHDPNAYQRLALRGSIGVGEGYMAGEWSCDDLPALVRIFVLNQDALLGLEKGLTRLMMPLFRLWYARRDNQPGGQSRQYRRPLRSRQRVLPAVSRRDSDVFLSDLPDPGHRVA
jgi:cyclopropane-fatty-acyl-phospholipid synthase